MFCHKCGTQVPDDAAFCSKCGARLTSDHADSEAAVMSDITQQPMNEVAAPGSKDTNTPQTGNVKNTDRKHLGKALIIGAILVSILAVFAIVSVITQKETPENKEPDRDSSSYQESSKSADSSEQPVSADSKTNDSTDIAKEETSTETALVDPVTANDLIYRGTGDAVTEYLNLNFRYLGDVMKLQPTYGTNINGDYYEGAPYEGYDGLILIYDEYYFVAWAEASPDAILVNGKTLDKNRDELVGILGTPIDEGDSYDGLEDEYRYTMEYVLQDDEGDFYHVMFSMPSANGAAQSITFGLYDDGI